MTDLNMLLSCFREKMSGTLLHPRPELHEFEELEELEESRSKDVILLSSYQDGARPPPTVRRTSRSGRPPRRHPHPHVPRPREPLH